MSDVFRNLVARLWWGRRRRIVRGILFRILKQEDVVKLGPLRGQRFRGNYAQFLGIYEMPVEQAVKKHLQPGDVFYDVGANCGYFSLLASLICGENGHVYSFEPISANIQVLQENTSNKSNCTVIEKAVSDTCGKAYMSIGDGVNASLVGEQQASTFEVELTTLDDFIRLNRYPQLIKIDVEGAETAVIAGAQRILGSLDAPTLIIEIHNEQADRTITTQLRDFGYKTSSLNSSSKKRNYPRHIEAHK